MPLLKKKLTNQIIKRGNTKYLLCLEDIKTEHNKLLCLFKKRGSVMPFKISLNKLFTDFDVMKNIRPDILLVLKTIYEKNETEHNCVKIQGHLRDNQYEIVYNNELHITMEGKNICRDLNLLGSMTMQDAFKIIYNTAFENGYQLGKQHTSPSEIPVSGKILKLVRPK